MFSNISQILLLYKTCGYHKKWLYAIYGGTYYGYVKIWQCGYMEHGLKYIAFCVKKKHIAHKTVCYNFPLVHDKPLGTPAFVKLVYSFQSSRPSPLQWRHNECDGASNHLPQDCLLRRLFRCNQRKHQSSASLAFVRGIHRWPVNSLHKGPVTRKMFPFDDVIMTMTCCHPHGW